MQYRKVRTRAGALRARATSKVQNDNCLSAKEDQASRNQGVANDYCK